MVPGRTLVVPVVLDEPARAERVARELSLRLDDGREVQAELWSLSPGPPVIDPSGWLAPIPTLLVHPPAEAPPGAGWVVLAAVPPDGAGQGLWADTDRWPLNWLPDPYRLGAPESAFVSAAPTDATIDQSGTAFLHGTAQRLAQSPITRWRARLYDATLAPPGPFDSGGAGASFEAPDADAARVLARIAEHTEARWQVALAWLEAESPQTAAHTRAWLAGAVVTAAESGPIALPVFDEDALVLTDLLPDLLSPFVDGPTRVLRAQAWLGARPERAVWVIDDAGRPGVGPDSASPTIGVAALGTRPVLARARIGAEPGPVVPIPPGTIGAVMVQADAPRGFDRAAERLQRVGVEAGEWSGTLTMVPASIPATPPGLVLGPFVPAWSMSPWTRAGTGPAGTPGPALTQPPPTRATLRRMGGRSAAAWSVLVECTLPTSGSTADESLTLWLGPFGVPTRGVRVRPDGRATDARTGEPLPDVRVARTADGWAAEIPVRSDVIEASGLVRLGLVRTHAGGGVSSWPRAVLPGQAEPGRAAIDLGWWDGLDPLAE